VLLAAEPGDDLNLDGNASRQLGHTGRCTGMAPGITEHLDQQIRAPIQDRSGASKPRKGQRAGEQESTVAGRMSEAWRPVQGALWEAALVDVVAAYFERFNAKKLDEMAGLFGSGYTYAEPLFPEPRDAAGHVALMRQIAKSYPDRQMRVRRRVPGAGGEVVEAVWSGTRADGEITMTLDILFAVDIDPKSSRISRMRGYYEPPA